MDGKMRVSLIPKYCSIYSLSEEELIELLLVVKDENQLKQSCGLIMEGFALEEVCSMVIYDLI